MSATSSPAHMADIPGAAEWASLTASLSVDDIPATMASAPMMSPASSAPASLITFGMSDTMADTPAMTRNATLLEAQEKGGSVSAPMMDPGREIYPADHRHGWLVLITVFLANFAIFGFAYTWGLYQLAYLKGDYAGESTFTISLIGSIGSAFVFVFGPFVSNLGKTHGIRIPLIVGTILTTLGILLASFATATWQLFLTQGVLVGVGGSLVFFSVAHLPSQWFIQRRGLASGVGLAGSSIGAVVMIPVSQVLIDGVGIRWTLRIIAAFTAVVLTIVSAFAKERIRPSSISLSGKSTRSEKVRALMDISQLRNTNIALLAFVSVIFSFGYMAPYFFLPSYASFIHLSDANGALMICIMSLANAAGRIALGWSADRAGAVNMLFISTLLSGLTCLVIWPFATSFGTLLLFSILQGFFQGGFVCIIPIVAALLVPLEDAANAIGIVLGLQFLGDLFGPAISGALVDATAPHTSYVPMSMFTGASGVVACLLLLPLRWKLQRGWWKKV